MRFLFGWLIGSLAFLGAVGCAGSSSATPTIPAGSTPGSAGFLLKSEAFDNDQAVPVRYTCDGENISPPLAWNGAPAGTQSLALIVDDPDAPSGVYTHWVLFNLPAGTQSLPAAMPKDERLTIGGVQGRNDGNQFGYTGPCPPAGKPHHYRFTLYALDTNLQIQSPATKQKVLDAMKGHVLGQTQLVGTYQRGSRWLRKTIR